jgi:transcriptional regulator GlxA family with amidase domain
VPAGAGLAELGRADTVVVPACASVHGHAPSSLLDALRAAHHRGARIAAICSGTFVLAEAGLLNGRRATTHWMHCGELAARYPRVRVDPSVLYVHDGVWTSAGSAAGLDMCLELVRQDHGSAVATEVARRIVSPPHRDGGQAQFISPVPARDARAVDQDMHLWAREHLADATVTLMARRAKVSTRTLGRQFRERAGTTPQAWLRRLRVGAAAELLETTDLTVEHIAHRVGLGTAANLRAAFAATFGVPPQHYRRTFHNAGAGGKPRHVPPHPGA